MVALKKLECHGLYWSCAPNQLQEIITGALKVVIPYFSFF